MRGIHEIGMRCALSIEKYGNCFSSLLSCVMGREPDDNTSAVLPFPAFVPIERAKPCAKVSYCSCAILRVEKNDRKLSVASESHK
jgi:hypothetical protein